jgi:hypothetical protein
LAVAALGGRLYAVGGRIDGNYSRNLAANEASGWRMRARPLIESYRSRWKPSDLLGGFRLLARIAPHGFPVGRDPAVSLAAIRQAVTQPAAFIGQLHPQIVQPTQVVGVDSEEYVVPGLQNRRILSSPIRDLEVHGYIIVKEKRNG